MNYNKGQLGQIAKQYGFVRDTFEKVLRLKEILTYLNTDEYLHEHLALKGGTAINMTIFNLPRLSVDLDLDFTPNLPLEDMEKAREKITKMLERYMTEEGYFLSGSSRYSHSLDSMLFQYQNAGDNSDNIKLELNYSLRSHIQQIRLIRLLTHLRLTVWSFQKLGVICFRCCERRIILIWKNVRRKQSDLLKNSWP